MTVKSKNVVTKFPCGTIYVVGPAVFVGKMPAKAVGLDSPEVTEILEDLQAVLKAGNDRN
jgi:hypothetical protein